MIDYRISPPTHGHPVHTRQYVHNVDGEFSYSGGVGPWVQTFYRQEFDIDEETGDRFVTQTSWLGTRQYQSYKEAIEDYYNMSLVS